MIYDCAAVRYLGSLARSHSASAVLGGFGLDQDLVANARICETDINYVCLVATKNIINGEEILIERPRNDIQYFVTDKEDGDPPPKWWIDGLENFSTLEVRMRFLSLKDHNY